MYLWCPQIHELFSSFDENPQGAASLAQVHKAVLQDGRTVAVKVQHPKVQTQSSKDIIVMEVITGREAVALTLALKFGALIHTLCHCHVCVGGWLGGTRESFCRVIFVFLCLEGAKHRQSVQHTALI